MKYPTVLCIAWLCCICICGFGQNQTATDSSHTLKRGFYKTYTEYLNNSPSITADFKTQLLTASKKDTTVIAGNYELLNDDVRIKKIWGFCDGENVFIRHWGLTGPKYWKLQVLGPHPYILLKQKTIIATGPALVALTQAAITAAVPAGYEILAIFKSGKPKYVWKKTMKKILADQPELLEAFNKEVKVISDKYRIKYLKLYSEAATAK